MLLKILLPAFATFTCLIIALLFGIIYLKVNRRPENLAFSVLCTGMAWMIWYTLRLQEIEDLHEALLVFRLQFAGAFVGIAALMHLTALITRLLWLRTIRSPYFYTGALFLFGLAFNPHILHALPPNETVAHFRDFNVDATGPWFSVYAASPLVGTLFACLLIVYSIRKAHTKTKRGLLQMLLKGGDSEEGEAYAYPARSHAAAGENAPHPGDPQLANTPAEALPAFTFQPQQLLWMVAGLALIVATGVLELMELLDIWPGTIQWPANPRGVAATCFCIMTGWMLLKEVWRIEQNKRHLAAANYRLQDLAQSRLQAVYDMQHQVRNKLNGVQWPLRSALCALQSSDDDRAKPQESLRTALNEVQEMFEQMDIMLNLARMQAGQPPKLGAKSAVDVAALIAQIGQARLLLEQEQQALAAPAAQPSHRLHVASELDSACPLVYGDSLKQVLINLLDNAVKYSPLGSRITVRVWELGSELYISIGDEGCGVLPVDRDHIFSEGFYRGQAELGGAGGIGIGLNLCRRLLQAQNGRIWVESEGENRGSVFIFALPL